MTDERNDPPHTLCKHDGNPIVLTPISGDVRWAHIVDGRHVFQCSSERED